MQTEWTTVLDESVLARSPHIIPVWVKSGKIFSCYLIIDLGKKQPKVRISFLFW